LEAGGTRAYAEGARLHLQGFLRGLVLRRLRRVQTEEQYAKPASADAAPTCLVHDTALDRVAEEGYFFRLSDYADALLELYETRPDFVRPEGRRNEVVSFVRAGLQDLSISRQRKSVGWAIPVPDDPEHTIYIWFDALSNYITALGWGNDEKRKSELFDRFWPGTHLTAKDICGSTRSTGLRS
jgi:methionyl-tRNA synthetase